jgi:hypothetical protein
LLKVLFYTIFSKIIYYGETGAKEKITSTRRSSTKTVQPVAHHEKREMNGVSVLTASGQRAESQMTTMEKMQATRDGISKKELLQLKEKAGLDYDLLSYILGAARATLINKKGYR